MKPGDWTQNQLTAFSITIVSQSRQDFFGSANLPGPVTPSLAGFMTTEDRDDAEDAETRKLLRYLDLVLDPQVGQEAAVDNLAAKPLEKLGYDDDEGMIFIRRALPVVICGIPSISQAYVCIIDEDNQLLLLLQGGRPLPSFEGSRSAKAITAYAANNKVRQTSINLPPISTFIFPAITMIGSNPIFYITVSAD